MGDPILSSDNPILMNPIVLFQQADPPDAPLVYTAEDFRMLIDAVFVTPGVVGAGAYTPDSSGQVRQHGWPAGGPHASLVTIKRGTYILPKYGGGPGKYIAQLTGDIDITIPAGPVSGTMYHKIVVYALDKADAPVPGVTSYGWAFRVIEGVTPGVEPTSLPGEMVLAVIGRTGQAAITDAMISDRRQIARSDLFEKAVNQEIITASKSWSKPFGARTVWIRVIGGGGGGGGCAGSSDTSREAGGSGGGGGGYTERWIDASTITAPLNIVVGAGGTGLTGVAYNAAAAYSNAGAASSATGGGNAALNMIANGGGGGRRYGVPPDNTNARISGGAGGTASGGGIDITGGDGGTSYSIALSTSASVPSEHYHNYSQTGTDSTALTGSEKNSAGTNIDLSAILNFNGLVLTGGSGGSTPLGGSQSQRTGAGDGYNGQAYGGGGSGAVQGGANVNRKGGNGANGVVIIYTYF